LYPQLMEHLPDLRFIEQYDPMDETAESKSQPFAYVADIVHEVKLGIEIDDVRGKGVSNDKWSSMVELRDKLAPGEKVAWFVVVCGDLERWAPPTVGLLEGSSNRNSSRAPSAIGSRASSTSMPMTIGTDSMQNETSSARLRKFFTGRSLRKS